MLQGILLSTSGFAQSNTLFNPDYNGDGFIGVDDILGALSFYDNAWDGPVAIVIYGCTYPLFAEYDALANVDDLRYRFGHGFIVLGVRRFGERG